MLLKFELNWMTVGQVIELQNDINHFETPAVYTYTDTYMCTYKISY